MDRRPAADTVTNQKGILGRYCALLEKHPFATAFVTLTIAFLPNIILDYPAVFMGDTHAEIIQAFPRMHDAGISYITSKRMLDSKVFLNQHHPVAHTLFLHALLGISRRLFGDFQMGLFACNLIQSALSIFAVSLCVSTLVRRYRFSGRTGALVVLLALFNPLMRNYMPLVTKDAVYGPVFLLTVFCVFPLLEGHMTRREIVALLVCCALTIVLRNDARYIMLIAFILIALTSKKSRKYAVPFVAYVLVFSTLYFNVLMPAIKATPGSRREMFSVPFQQTARYLRDYGDDVTKSEHDAIDAILDYDNLASRYVGIKADKVKGTFNEMATTEELKNYFVAWAKMLVRHPDAYVQATMNNYYMYFYPNDTIFLMYGIGWSNDCMDYTNQTIEEGLGVKVSKPEVLTEWSDPVYWLWGRIRTMPGLVVLSCPSFYSWMLISIFFYTLRKRFGFAYWVMPFLAMGICLMGPCNGYYGRYQYPVTLSLPIVMLVFYCQLHHRKAEEKR